MTSQVERYAAAAVATRDAEWIWHLENPGSAANEFIAAHVRAAVAEAVAREREANCHTVCQLCARGEQVQFSERLGWWHPKIARGRGARCEAAAIRSRGEGEGER